VCVVAAELARNLDLEPCNFRVVDVSGQPIAIAGQVELDVTVGSESVTHKFVVASIVSPALIGCDFLRRFGCTVDFARMILESTVCESLWT
jgi:hypothetical protein